MKPSILRHLHHTTWVQVAIITGFVVLNTNTPSHLLFLYTNSTFNPTANHTGPSSPQIIQKCRAFILAALANHFFSLEAETTSSCLITPIVVQALYTVWTTVLWHWVRHSVPWRLSNGELQMSYVTLVVSVRFETSYQEKTQHQQSSC